MMIESVLSRSLRVMFAGGLALGMHSAFAQAITTANDPAAAADSSSGDMQRVEVTGSSIKRLASQTALPITSIKADEFVKQGMTTAQEVLNSVSSNQSQQGSSQSVGSGTGGQATADLRGLGSDKTLVLLNGRRIANHPMNGSSVDLNIIPLAALDRVEVLRDGASAIYGTDAIGGVINFITKRSVKGVTINADHYAPTASGGGQESRINVSAGIGDLATDGFNLFGVVDVHKQNALKATDRSFSSTSIIPSRGVDNGSNTSSPANFSTADGISTNPYYASGCSNVGLIANDAKKICRTDTTKYIDDIPETRQESFLGKATFKLSEDDTASLEYLHSRSTNFSSVAPAPVTGLTMTSTSPYYPGKGITPAVDGVTDQNLSVNWRTVSAGNRQEFDVSTSDRLVLSSEGLIGGWDYNVGLNYSISKSTSSFAGGYISDTAIQQGITDGIINPFGDQSAAGTAYLAENQLLGEYLYARMVSTGVDAKISREIFQLPAGGVGFALGTEFRHDKATYDVNTGLASQATSSGYADAQDQAGQRNIAALFSELSVPLRKDLDLSLAARYDHYNDVGGSFNPKIGLRYQPTKQVLLRTSYNTGFRAPTLYDLYGPASTTFTSGSYNDPVLCPGGNVANGGNALAACDTQQNIRYGGNVNLKPEKSKTFSAGIVIEPVKSVTMSFDYYNIIIRDKIGYVSESTMFANYEKYKDNFVYSADGTTLEYLNSTMDNLGKVHTSGIDTSFMWRLPASAYGNFTFNLDGTWVKSYKYQNEEGGDYVENVGIYGDDNPVFRWKHNASISWALGKWSANFSNKYMSGYTDQNSDIADGYYNKVKAYSTYSLSGTYTGLKNTEVTLGVKNLFDTAPPYTNQGTTFQTGYDPRYTDPLGRTLYAHLTYKF